jgi:hypothetical protein
MEQELTNIALAAVQDCFIVSIIFANVCEGVDDPQSQLLPLSFFVNCNVLDVANTAQSSQIFAFHENTADCDNAVRRFVYND